MKTLADGKIIIETGVDSKGAEKDLFKLKIRLKNLSKELRAVPKALLKVSKNCQCYRAGYCRIRGNRLDSGLD